MKVFYNDRVLITILECLHDEMKLGGTGNTSIYNKEVSSSVDSDCNSDELKEKMGECEER